MTRLTDWDTLVAKHGPDLDALVEVTGLSRATARAALLRRGYVFAQDSRGRPAGPPKVRVSLTLLESQIARAGGLEQFREQCRRWAARKFGVASGFMISREFESEDT